MNKKLIAILTLVMFALTLLPMGAFAATKTSTVGNVPIITGTPAAQQFANIYINEDVQGNLASGDVILFTLPSELEFPASVVTGMTITRDGGPADVAPGAQYSVSKTSDQTIIVTLQGGTLVTSNVDKLTVNLGPIKVAKSGTGDIELIMDAGGTAIQDGKFVIGRFATGSATASVLSTKTNSDGNGKEFGTIRISENAAGALANGDTVKFKLNGDFEWNTTEFTVGKVYTGTRGLKLTVSVVNDEVLELKVASAANESTGGPGVVDIKTIIDIGSDAKLGDVKVSTSGSISGDLTLGTYADYSVKVSAETAKELTAGKEDQKMAKLTIEDVIAGSILDGRTIKLELPEGVRFANGLTAPAVTATNATISGSSVSSEGRIATYTVATASTNKAKLEFKDVELDVAPRFTGDVKITVSGTASATGEAVVATVTPAVKVAAEAANINIGVQGQPLKDIFVTETAKEVFKKDGLLVLEIDNGLTFSNTPKVEVTEGNVTIDTIARAENNTQVTIKIKSESTTPATIKISNVNVTADRSVPEGDVKVTVKGSAVVDPMFTAVAGTQAAWDIATKTAAAVKVATVVTPAGENVVQPVVMTVGSTVYTIDGVEMTMDVAPYIKDSRTYFPVRYVAQALGITADNVVWDGAQRTVTIFRANRIVQVTIGSTTMLVNGVPLTMDVAPEITAERTMLPIRFVAQGLGVNVNWDAATQTITLN